MSRTQIRETKYQTEPLIERQRRQGGRRRLEAKINHRKHWGIEGIGTIRTITKETLLFLIFLRRNISPNSPGQIPPNYSVACCNLVPLKLRHWYLYPGLRDYKSQDAGQKQGWYLLGTFDWLSTRSLPKLAENHGRMQLPGQC